MKSSPTRHAASSRKRHLCLFRDSPTGAARMCGPRWPFLFPEIDGKIALWNAGGTPAGKEARLMQHEITQAIPLLDEQGS